MVRRARRARSALWSNRNRNAHQKGREVGSPDNVTANGDVTAFSGGRGVEKDRGCGWCSKQRVYLNLFDAEHLCAKGCEGKQ